MKNQIIILGAGESGVGAALLAKVKGLDVYVSESNAIKESYKKELINNNINFEENGHSLSILKKTKCIIKSPGIANENLIIQKAIKKNIEIIDELEFAFRYNSKPIIAITGSNGKTTTSLLIHHLLSKSGINASLAGNIGHSLARQIIDDKAEVYVVEVSSFQLDGIQSFKPTIAIILNITLDHLDRYEYDFQKYADSKIRITKNLQEKELLIYNKEDSTLNQRIDNLKRMPQLAPIGISPSNTLVGCNTKNGLIVQLDKTKVEIKKEHFPLKGDHNIINMLSAIVATLYYGLSPKKIQQHLPTFKNAPNRMEYITTIKGVEFVNDTKATNVEASYYAIKNYENTIIWIAGGQDKGNNYNKIKTLVEQKVKAIICLGVDNKKLINFFKPIIPNIYETKKINVAVKKAFEYANNSGVVLLSPACSSFDLFENYAQRGELFKKAVLALKDEVYG